MEQYRNDEALLKTESYLEKMQKIFEEREATYQKRKAEYDGRNQELEQIRKELWKRSQTLEQKEEQWKQNEENLAKHEAELVEKEAVLERRETEFAEEKAKYEAQLQKQILEHQLELEALRNEKMLVEDARRAYEYQTASTGVRQNLYETEFRSIILLRSSPKKNSILPIAGKATIYRVGLSICSPLLERGSADLSSLNPKPVKRCFLKILLMPLLPITPRCI